MTDDVGVCVLYACILQLHSAFPTITSLAQSVGYFQLVQQLGPARTLDGGDVDEDVHAAILWCDKTKSFGGVEPLYHAVGHSPVSCFRGNSEVLVVRLRGYL